MSIMCPPSTIATVKLPSVLCLFFLTTGTSHKHKIEHSTVDLMHLDGVNMTEVCYIHNRLKEVMIYA